MKFCEFKRAKSLSLANELSFVNQALANEIKQADFRYISCFEDPILGSKNLIKCEIGSISYVLALLCKYSGCKQDYFDELDDGFLSGESSVGEEEIEELVLWLKDVKNIIIDSSFFTHKDSKMLFEFLEILGIDVVLADGLQSEVMTDGILTELKELEVFDGSVVYQRLSLKPYIKGGINFAAASKIKDGDEIVLSANEFKFEGKFTLDTSLKGTIAFVGVDSVVGYNFKRVDVAKIR